MAVAPDSPLWLIAAERVRQQNEEGWTPEHDDRHVSGELVVAAACYALPSRFVTRHANWPFERSAWKPVPDDRVRELKKAGALIAAEIDRLLRGRVRYTEQEPER